MYPLTPELAAVLCEMINEMAKNPEENRVIVMPFHDDSATQVCLWPIPKDYEEKLNEVGKKQLWG